MIAIDTNLLVYAHRTDSPHHHRAAEILRNLAAQPTPFSVPWPCVSEFLAIATHPRIYRPPSPLPEALRAVSAIAKLKNVRFICETSNHLELLAGLVGAGIIGPKLHDARIAAICLGNGVTELLTADRDFSYFPELKTRNPLV